ncbi:MULTISPECIES: TlpA disulfide reductase family protein [unclassified Bradyrhizobium]|uniref:TlpA family protein disulfide reductase n=1 Tax=unclassified Bradyrhizobium TaxID=2631580 RepID=UPI003394A282
MTSLTESASQVGAANVLSVGSRAPSIEFVDWLRGQPVTKFEPGNVYIVDFCATGCGTCIASMCNLVILQDKYRNNGVEVVGIAAHEHALTADEARASLDAWLAKSVTNLNYAVAFDYAGEMNKLWMDPSFSVGIPTSFVVDRDGRLAFIGHPTQLDNVLPKVLNGSWAVSDEAKALDAERMNTDRRRKRELSQKRALAEPMVARLEPAMKSKDWAAALSAVEEALASMPDEVTVRELHAELLLHNIRDMGAGLPVLRQLVRDAIDKKSVVWTSVAIRQLFDPAKDYSGFQMPSALPWARTFPNTSWRRIRPKVARARSSSLTGRSLSTITRPVKGSRDEGALSRPWRATGVRSSHTGSVVQRRKTRLPKDRNRDRQTEAA